MQKLDLGYEPQGFKWSRCTNWEAIRVVTSQGSNIILAYSIILVNRNQAFIFDNEEANQEATFNVCKHYTMDSKKNQLKVSDKPCFDHT